jgi:hypothetical protein
MIFYSASYLSSDGSASEQYVGEANSSLMKHRFPLFLSFFGFVFGISKID